MKRAFLGVVAAVLVLFGAATAGAQSTTPKGEWTFTGWGLYSYWLWGFAPSGGSIDILYNGVHLFDGVDTIFENDIGAGWQTNVFYRDPVTGGLYTGSDTTVTSYDQVEFLDDLGIRQGILWNPDQERNLLEAFLFYRLRYDHNFQTQDGNNPGFSNDINPALIFQSGYPDAEQILNNAVIVGLSLNTEEKDPVHKTRQGVYAEASAEWGPSFLFNSIGGADYYRFNATLEGWLTLYTSAQKDPQLNLFSVYLADYVGVDFAGGSSIPIFVFESYGGHYGRAANATVVHGLDDGYYGANFKALNNLELRITGPAIVWQDLVPALFVFLDTEYYNGFYNDPANDPPGFVGSTGAGIYLNFFELCDFNVYFAYPFAGTKVGGAPYTISAAFNLAF